MTDRETAFFGWDGKEYHGYAQSLLAGNGDDYPRYFNNVRPPFYPIFLIPFVALSTKVVWHIQFVQCVLGVLQSIILAKVAGRWVGQRAGDWAFAIVLFHPFLIYNAPFVMTETLFITLLWGGILCLQHLLDVEQQRPTRWLIAAGVLLALGCLTRPTLQLFLPVAVCWLGWQAWKSGGWRLALQQMALFTGVVSALLLPFLLRNVHLYSEFTIAARAGQGMYYFSNSPDYLRLYEAKSKEEYYEIQDRMVSRISVEGGGSNEIWWAEAQDFVQNHRAEWLQLQGYKFLHFWTPWVNPLIFPRGKFLLSLFTVTPLFILAFVELWRKRRRGGPFLTLLLGLIVIGYLVGGFLFHVAVRYRMPFVDIAFIVLTASFLARVDFARVFVLKGLKRPAPVQAS